MNSVEKIKQIRKIARIACIVLAVLCIISVFLPFHRLHAYGQKFDRNAFRYFGGFNIALSSALVILFVLLNKPKAPICAMVFTGLNIPLYIALLIHEEYSIDFATSNRFGRYFVIIFVLLLILAAVLYLIMSIKLQNLE